jgi:transcriptional regulator with XRE-family HTH domain
MKAKSMTLSQMARIMNKSLRLISDRVNTSKSINLKNLEEMLDVLDYKVVVMPKGGKLPKDAFEIRVVNKETKP